MSLQVELLEQSFDEVKPQADDFADSFYKNLFTAYPEARPLFANTNMAEQKKKLVGSLVLVVENLKNPDTLGSSLRGLGARHVKYGALPAHYPLVGNSLLTTFEQYLGDKWTPQVKQAWVDAYGAITEIMLDGADYSADEVAMTPSTTETQPEEPAESGLQVELLEQSFDEVKPQADSFSDSFYENLFTAYPEAEPLFANTNMAEQKKKLVGSLVLVVENLKNPDVLGSSLRGLGARHVKYGALPAHYPLVGNALLTTFEQYLGDKWTPQVKQAWVDAYGAITEIMLDGADYSPDEVAFNAPSREEMTETYEYGNSTTEIANETMTTTSMKTQVADRAEFNSHAPYVAADGTLTAPSNDKAGLWALLGGGAMGVLAAILLILL
jgi:nitric oxide dioxygenase